MHTEAVFFFTDGQVSKEMLYSEFAAVLDGVVPLPSFAGMVAHAVYVQLDERLQVTGLVFFVLAFDRAGRVDPKWNVPLRDMAERGKPGPRLGNTAPRLVCRTQGTARYHDHLWEPFGRTVHDPYREIERVLKRNRLGLLPVRETAREVEEEVPVLTHVAAEEPRRLTQLEAELKAARVRIHHFQQRDEQWQRKVRDLKAELEAVQQRLAAVLTRHQRLEQHVKQVKAEYSKRLQAMTKRSSAG